MSSKNERFTFTMPFELKKFVENESVRRGISMSAYINTLIYDNMNQREILQFSDNFRELILQSQKE